MCASVNWNSYAFRPGEQGFDAAFGGFHAAYPAYPGYSDYPAYPAYPGYPVYSAYPAMQPPYAGYPAYPAYPAQGADPSEAWQDGRQRLDLRDYGGNPHVINIEAAAEQNTDFRRAIWTGRHLQVVLMSIPPGTDIGLEVHPNVDQFIRIEEGFALVQMGPARNRLTFVRRVSDDDAIMIPAGTWHNVTNIGPRPLKLYTIYSPPEHRFGTVHRTKAEAEAAEQGQRSGTADQQPAEPGITSSP